MIAVIGNASFIAMLALMFANHKYNKVCLMLMISITYVCIAFGICSFQNTREDIKQSAVLIPYMIIGVVYINYMARHFPTLIDVIIKKNQQNSKFKQIFDNLDETVFIVNKNKIQIGYANNFFFK